MYRFRPCRKRSCRAAHQKHSSAGSLSKLCENAVILELILRKGDVVIEVEITTFMTKPMENASPSASYKLPALPEARAKRQLA